MLTQTHVCTGFKSALQLKVRCLGSFFDTDPSPFPLWVVYGETSNSQRQQNFADSIDVCTLLNLKVYPKWFPHWQAWGVKNFHFAKKVT